MTQAFNLAQFANNLNSSGQVNANGLQSGLATQWITSAGNIYYSGNVGIGGDSGTNRFTVFGSSGRLYVATNGTDYTIDSTDDVTRGKNIYFRYCGTDTSRARIWTDGELGFQAQSGYTATLPGGSTFYPAFYTRAWVTFNSFGGTPSINGSGNCSSIGDLGVGYYQVNFITAMPDINYAVSFGSPRGNGRWLSLAWQPQGTFADFTGAASKATTNVRITFDYWENTPADADNLMVTIAR